MANGNANGFTWLAYVKAYWPIVLALLAVTAWANQRLETADQKQLRIDLSIAHAVVPVYAKLAEKADLDKVPPQSVLDNIKEIKAALIRLELAHVRLEQGMTQHMRVDH